MSQANVDMVRRLYEAHGGQHFEDWAGVFEGWRVVADELIDAGDEVVGVQHVSGTGRRSGASLDARYAILFTIHANKIVRAREYATRAAALEAVELAE